MQYHVSATASTPGDGSILHPFRTISEAAALAQPGDEVLVAPGVYREEVIPRRGGIDDKHRIVYKSIVPRSAIILGSEPWTDWEKDGTLYHAALPSSLFPGANPFDILIEGDWFGFDPLKPRKIAQVFVDGKAIEECFSREETLARMGWMVERQGSETLLFLSLHSDPSRHTIEITTRRHCFYPDHTGIGYITVSGFCLKQAATQWAPPTGPQDAIIGPNWARGWIIEDCEIADSTCCGISLGKLEEPAYDNAWTKHRWKDGTQLERECVLRLLRQGWEKDHIGSHIIRRCLIHHCGQAGIVGHAGCAFSRIEDCEVRDINIHSPLHGCEVAGIKLHAALDVIIDNCHIHHNTRGIWLDWQAQGTRITRCVFHDHNPLDWDDVHTGLEFGEDLFIEVSHGPTLVDHCLFLSLCSLRLSAQGIALCHNLIRGSLSYVGEGVRNSPDQRADSVRYTPYHLPHQTAVAGFMTILSGDVHFRNNVFLPQSLPPEALATMARIHALDVHHGNLLCGTHPFSGYPTSEIYWSRFQDEQAPRKLGGEYYYGHLPVSYQGNVYFDQALPALEDTEAVRVKDTGEVPGTTLEEIRVYLQDHLPSTHTEVIASSTLPMAFESEQRYENPDGSPLVLDHDFDGNARGINPTPGPFEHYERNPSRNEFASEKEAAKC